MPFLNLRFGGPDTVNQSYRVGAAVAIAYACEDRMAPVTSSISQPLPPVDAGTVGGAVKAISKEVGNARRQLDAYNKCETAARAGNYDAAIQAANAGTSTYATATLVRICRLNAYLAKKAPTDTIIANAKDILRLDPKNKIALNAAGQALSDKSDALAKTDSVQSAALNDQAV